MKTQPTSTINPHNGDTLHFIQPDWPAPYNVKAYTSTRDRGISQTPYDSFNLADHVGDNLEAVQENRQRLRTALAFPGEPCWLQQVHGIEVVNAAQRVSDLQIPPTPPFTKGGTYPMADASFATMPNTVCAVLTADCLPVLLCNRAGTQVAAIHAGWKSLVAGIIEATIKKLQLPGDELLAWLGPAIGSDVFEVGSEVRNLFLQRDASAAQAFKPSPAGRWLADIYQLARLRLQSMNVTNIYGGNFCTYTDSERFFSYRRDGERTGRMASLIWISK